MTLLKSAALACILLLLTPGCFDRRPDGPSTGKVEGAPEQAAKPAPRPAVLRREAVKMGTRFEIQIVGDDPAAASAAIEAAYAEIDRVEALLSEWREDSEISEVNRRAGDGPVSVGPELFEVVERSLELSERTDGAFDITFASCGRLWSVREQLIPTDEAIAACLPLIDYRRVQLDRSSRTIALATDQTQIGIGAIGKGYGVDRAAQVLIDGGVEHFVVNGGGDIRARGMRGDRPWRVGIAHPRRKGELLGTVTIPDGAVVSSGDYERFFERDGTRYHHILDPATGRPARASVAVTVFAADATTADALATALFILGPERGLAVARAMPDVEALIVGPDLELHQTEGFEALWLER